VNRAPLLLGAKDFDDSSPMSDWVVPGIVMGLEVSRLARNNADWHRLLEICALAGTLILDEDGVYDPTNFNDRLLLGLKGTMSEAELHV
jgi:DNA invertase Pin-like site-specific DNA recombinase